MAAEPHTTGAERGGHLIVPCALSFRILPPKLCCRGNHLRQDSDHGGEIVATAIGTLELDVPNPMCVQGRTVRLANVITLPEHRGCGHGTFLVRDVIEWARSIDADRVDLSSTEVGQGLYDKQGFVFTSAPRMKLVL